jgi:hypothetical protein
MRSRTQLVTRMTLKDTILVYADGGVCSMLARFGGRIENVGL